MGIGYILDELLKEKDIKKLEVENEELKKTINVENKK